MKNAKVLIAGVLALCSTISNANNQLSVDQINTIRQPNQKFADSFWWKYFPGSSKSKQWWFRHKDRGDLSGLVTQPPCPSRYWGMKGQGLIDKSRWASHVEKLMGSFPKVSIDFCSEPTYLVIDGLITNHPDAVTANYRSVATAAIRQNLSGETAVMTAIFETDFHALATGGKVYNEELEQVCAFKFDRMFEGDLLKTQIDCAAFGNLSGVYTIEKPEQKGNFNSSKVQRSTNFTLLGKNENFSFLVTNLPPEKAAEKYPEIFKP